MHGPGARPRSASGAESRPARATARCALRRVPVSLTTLAPSPRRSAHSPSRTTAYAPAANCAAVWMSLAPPHRAPARRLSPQRSWKRTAKRRCVDAHLHRAAREAAAALLRAPAAPRRVVQRRSPPPTAAAASANGLVARQRHKEADSPRPRLPLRPGSEVRAAPAHAHCPCEPPILREWGTYVVSVGLCRRRGARYVLLRCCAACAPPWTCAVCCARAAPRRFATAVPWGSWAHPVPPHTHDSAAAVWAMGSRPHQQGARREAVSWAQRRPRCP